MAKSTLVSLFEALTGGEEAGAGAFGFSSAFTLGTGTFPRGILGVCSTGSSTAAGLRGGAGVTAGRAVVVALGGVLGTDASEETWAIASTSSKVMTGASGGIGLAGLRAVFASEVFVHNGRFFVGAGLSSCTGLDSRRVAELVELCAVFCLFAARSTAKSFSFPRSFSWRASYGDLMGTDFPIGPFGVPSSVFSDLWRSCWAFARAVFEDGATCGRATCEGGWKRRGGRRRRALLRLLFEQRRQVGLGDAHRVGHLDHDALVQRQLIALVQLVAVLVVRVAEEVAGLIIDHDPVVEGVELEKAILPLLLLLADVGRVEAAELGDGCGLRGRELRVRCAAEGRRHRCIGRVVFFAQGMGDVARGLHGRGRRPRVPSCMTETR
jgi:hypothetical protein